MRILIVRHGETPLNRARVVQPADTPLSDLGHVQAARLAERLRDAGLAAIVSSHLPRARMTAAALEAATGLTAHVEPMFQERNFGDWRGTAYADLTEDIFADDHAPPGGETWEEFRLRVAEAWRVLVARATTLPGPVAVVTHGLVCRALARGHLALSGQPAPDYWHNTGMTEVDAAPPHVLRRLNCIEHLAGLGVEAGGISGM